MSYSQRKGHRDWLTVELTGYSNSRSELQVTGQIVSEQAFWSAKKAHWRAGLLLFIASLSTLVLEWLASCSRVPRKSGATQFPARNAYKSGQVVFAAPSCVAHVNIAPFGLIFFLSCPVVLCFHQSPKYFSLPRKFRSVSCLYRYGE